MRRPTKPMVSAVGTLNTETLDVHSVGQVPQFSQWGPCRCIWRTFFGPNSVLYSQAPMVWVWGSLFRGNTRNHKNNAALGGVKRL